MHLKIVLAIVILLPSAFAQSPLAMLQPVKEQVKMKLWNEGIQKAKPLKIKDLTSLALPSEITVPLNELDR